MTWFSARNETDAILPVRYGCLLKPDFIGISARPRTIPSAERVGHTSETEPQSRKHVRFDASAFGSAPLVTVSA
jgi:hypothetical protein